jgi:hypothetical protein
VVLGAECHHLNVSFVHPNLVIATLHVQFGEEPHTLELVEEFIHDNDQEHVAHPLGVQGAVVDT